MGQQVPQNYGKLVFWHTHYAMRKILTLSWIQFMVQQQKASHEREASAPG